MGISNIKGVQKQQQQQQKNVDDDEREWWSDFEYLWLLFICYYVFGL